MEELAEKLSGIKESIDAIRKTGKLSHWRMVYADTLCSRAQEYVAVDRYPEAKLVAEKLERWIQAHKPALETNKADTRPPMIFWNVDLLNKIVARIRSTLETKKMLVPATERDSINRRLNLVETWIQKGEYLVAHDELLALRSALIARLRRSYRARVVATSAYQNTTAFQNWLNKKKKKGIYGRPVQLAPYARRNVPHCGRTRPDLDRRFPRNLQRFVQNRG